MPVITLYPVDQDQDRELGGAHVYQEAAPIDSIDFDLINVSVADPLASFPVKEFVPIPGAATDRDPDAKVVVRELIA